MMEACYARCYLMLCLILPSIQSFGPYLSLFSKQPDLIRHRHFVVLDPTTSSSSAHDDDILDIGDDSPSTLRSLTFCMTNDEEVDLLCDFLMEIGAYSTSITDADRGTDAEQPLFAEPSANCDPFRESTEVMPIWNRCNVTAHFSASTDLKQVVQLLADTFDTDRLQYHVEAVPNKDWVVHVQKGWKPIVVANKFVLTFPWHTEEDVANALVGTTTASVVQLRLQGGIAFGTGEHPTTQLCLEWIDKVVREELERHDTLQVMDYGAGSGVLGLAACAIGRNRISAVGIDVDFDACCIANANAEMNKLSMQNYLPPFSGTLDAESKSLLLKAHVRAQKQSQQSGQTTDDVILPLELESRLYDICVANILAGSLCTLAATLGDLTKSGGRIGLSGILPHQCDDIITAYRKAGFDGMRVAKSLGGWILVTGTKN